MSSGQRINTYNTERQDASHYEQHTFARALISAVLSLALGLAATYLAVQVIPLEWELNDALLAVGTASFAAAFFSVLLNRALAGRDEGPEHGRGYEERR